MDSPDSLLILLSISVFLLFSFCFYIFSCRFRVVDKLTHVGFRVHGKIASRIVSYRF